MSSSNTTLNSCILQIEKKQSDLETGSSTSFLIFPSEKWQDFAQC
jgi:hypothetical protein